MSTFTKDEFFKDLVAVCRKHKCTWLDCTSSWIDSIRFEFNYCCEDGEEHLEVHRRLPPLEVDCAELWKREG